MRITDSRVTADFSQPEVHVDGHRPEPAGDPYLAANIIAGVAINSLAERVIRDETGKTSSKP